MLCTFLSFTSLLLLNNAQPDYYSSDYFIVEECIDYDDGTKSRVCYCVDPSEVESEQGAVHCYHYDRPGCDPKYLDESATEWYGGCDPDGNLYVVNGCAAAEQEYSEEADNCEYWVDTQDNIYPLEVCLLGGITTGEKNCDQSALSCKYSCEDDKVVMTYYDSDYECAGNYSLLRNITETSGWTCPNFVQGVQCNLYSSTCDTSATKNCAVRVDTYTHSDYCQSSKTDWKTTQPQTDCNYWERFTNYGIGLEVCGTETFGYFEFQYKYVCNSDGNIEEYHYLDNDCKDGPDVIEENWVASYNSSDDEGIYCNSDNDICKSGTYNYNRYGCGYSYYQYNAESTDYERPYALGVCTPYYDEDDRELPWYTDIYYAQSIYNKGRRSIFYYFDETCQTKNWLFDDVDSFSFTDYGCDREFKGGFKNNNDKIKDKFFECR